MDKQWYLHKSVTEVVEYLIENHLENKDSLITEINEVMERHWTDQERVCSLWRPMLWFDEEKKEVRKEIQLFRTFEILRNTRTYPFDKLCESEYSNCFTRLLVRYKDEDDDYISLSPFLQSPYFQNLSYLYIKDYPMGEQEEKQFIKILPLRPQLKQIDLYAMFDFKKQVEQYIKSANLDIQVGGNW
jgi:hypothetical protein